ncbi:MAG: hypothetical protein M3Y37_06225, partial [Chloroflexota bacterium]|nr:hypothetical protein [Chloroflexota bacterium]
LHWPGGPDTVVLIHDVGGDLDDWRGLPASLAGQGYHVLAIDLPGHGLSDDPWEQGLARETIAEVVAGARSGGQGRRFAISAGRIAPLVGGAELDALIAISPAPDDDWAPDQSAAPCLIFVGGGDPGAAAAADRYFHGRRGWSVVSSFGVRENGSKLLAGSWARHLTEQAIAFLRDYRTPEPGAES